MSCVQYVRRAEGIESRLGQGHLIAPGPGPLGGNGLKVAREDPTRPGSTGVARTCVGVVGPTSCSQHHNKSGGHGVALLTNATAPTM